MEINWFYAIALVFLFFGAVFLLTGDFEYALIGIFAGGVFAYLGFNGKKEGQNACCNDSSKPADIKCS